MTGITTATKSTIKSWDNFVKSFHARNLLHVQSTDEVTVDADCLPSPILVHNAIGSERDVHPAKALSPRSTTQTWDDAIKAMLYQDAIDNWKLRNWINAEFEAPSIEIEGMHLCGELHAIARRIDASRSILALKDNWDDDGSEAYDAKTWRQAVKIVIESANGYWRSGNEAPALPTIAPGPDSSIDVSWTIGTRHLLVNVPQVETGSVTFSGIDTADRNRIVKGRLPEDETNEWLMLWLMA